MSSHAHDTTMPTAQAPLPVAGAPSKDALTHEIEGLVYVLDRLPRKQARSRSVVTVQSAANGSTPLVDRVDLYAFRGRHGFAQLVADTFGKQVGEILGHLAVLLDTCERAQGSEARPSAPVLTADRRHAAEKILDAEDLLDRAAQALDALGYVGETANKQLTYLVATSRLLAKPLSAILFAASGTGKSELLDKLALLLPEESVEFLSRLTPQALYYAGADHLRHKVVVVDEQAGAAEADYAVRTLQTKGLLRLAVPVKGKTEPFTVHGPIALLSGTTRDDLNPENLSRCLELSLDDSAEQTKRVQDAQRQACTGERREKVDLEGWRDAQRILEPLEVVIPYATQLTFPSRTTKDRRDNAKLLGLIRSHALLCQRRRDRDKDGQVIAQVEDYQVVYDLLRPVVQAEVEGLSPRAAALYRVLAEKEGPTLTRRETAALLGWSYMTTARAIDELLAHELLCEVERDYPRRFRLLDGSLLGHTATLTPPDDLAERRSSPRTGHHQR